MHAERLSTVITVACLGALLTTASAALAQGVPRSPDTDQKRGMLFDSTLVLPYWTRALVFDRDLRTSSGDGSHYEAHWNSLANRGAGVVSDGELNYSGWIGRDRFDSDQRFWSAMLEDVDYVDNDRSCPPDLEMGCIEYRPFRGQLRSGTMDVNRGSWSDYEFIAWWALDQPPLRAIEWYDPLANATYRRIEVGSLAGWGSDDIKDEGFPGHFIDSCVKQMNPDSSLFCWRI